MGFENGKVVRVTLRASGLGEEQVNTFHYDLDDSGSIGSNDPQTLADLFRDDVVPLWKAFFRTDWTIDPVVVTEEKDPQAPTAPRSEWTSGTAVAGTVGTGNDILPLGCCPIVTLKTAHIGRRFTGRMFVGGTWQEQNSDSGVVASGTVTVIQAFLDAIPVEPDLITGPADGSAKWSVYSRTQRGANLDPYLSAITNPILRSRFHFLRSRAIA
jgi:hypothetical protein